MPDLVILPLFVKKTFFFDIEDITPIAAILFKFRSSAIKSSQNFSSKMTSSSINTIQFFESFVKFNARFLCFVRPGNDFTYLILRIKRKLLINWERSLSLESTINTSGRELCCEIEFRQFSKSISRFRVQIHITKLIFAPI